MSTEVVTIIIAIVTASIALGGLIVRGQNHLREEMRYLREDMQYLRAELLDQRKEIHKGISDLRERMANLEGLVEGLREALVSRRIDEERRVAEEPEEY